MRPTAIIGVADHSGWAVLLTVARGGTLIDRRRVELVDGGLPRHPHHHEGQALPVKEAVKLVGRVRASAEQHATAALATIERAVAAKVVGIAIRACPVLPASVADRIADYRAQNVADSVMYREALARAAKARGWSVSWYAVDDVFDDAADAMGLEDIDDHLRAIGRSLGPPWQRDHKLAMAAAIAAGTAKRSRRP